MIFDWRGQLTRAAPRLMYALDGARHGKRNPISKWRSDAAFLAVLATIESQTLVDPERCYMLWQLAHHTASIPGEAAELGVYMGGTARLLAAAMPSRRLHLFDTFGGMPETDAKRDKHRPGDFADTSLQA